MATARFGSTATRTLVWQAPKPIQSTTFPLRGDPVPPQTIVAIGRKMYCAFYNWEAAPSGTPQNSDLRIIKGVERSWLSVGAVRHAAYVAGNPDGSLVALEQAIRTAQAETHLPVIGYWPLSLQTGAVPSSEYVGVEAYWKDTETLAAFEQRVRTALRRCPKAMIIAQCYTSNTTNQDNLAALVPVYARLARDERMVGGILIFSGYGRATGYQDHPEVHPSWTQLYAGITGVPAVTPKPEPPVPQPTLSATVKARIAQFGAAFPLPQGAPGQAHDDRCRAWTVRLAEQLKHDFGDAYGAKRADPHRPLSKDAFARLESPGMSGWDVMSGAGTGTPTLVTNPTYHDLAGQVFVEVAAVNHLGAVVEPPIPPIPPIPEPCTCEGPATYETSLHYQTVIDAIRIRYREVHGREPAESDIGHNLWRWYREARWDSLSEILDDIQ